MNLRGIHHIAIICSDYVRSRAFYVDTLGLPIVSEEFRAERNSHKLNLALPDGTQIELFSFPNPPARLTHPEACGLRHLALRVSDLAQAVASLNAKGIAVEPIRIDAATNAPFTFFADPDGLPIELYQEDSGEARLP
jgi:glyoxylase I family protein